MGAYAISNMAISPDRTKLAITSKTSTTGTLTSLTGRVDGALLCRFNSATGVVYDGILLDTSQCYGVSFSPDNSKLYVNRILFFNTQSDITQYDITKHDSSSIVSSLSAARSISGLFISGLKLYNDSLYIAYGGAGAPYIHRINKPNLAGVACDFQDSAIPLNSDTKCRFSLPNDVVFPIAASVTSLVTMDTTICGVDGLFPAISLEATKDYKAFLWNDGSTEAIHQVTEPGTYWVQTQNGCHAHTDTFILKMVEFPEPVISIDVNVLRTTQLYNTYQWMLDGVPITGATQRTYTVTANGDYRVIVTKNGLCVDTSNIYKVNNTAINDVDNIAAQISLYPNPANNQVYISAPVSIRVSIYTLEGKQIMPLTDTRAFSVSSLAEGLYFIHFYDKKGKLVKVDKLVKN